MHLLKFGVVPIINENDTVSTDEIELAFGDNDRLSALVATLVDADMLQILTDTDGLYTADPRHDPEASCISLVEEITPEIKNYAGKTEEMLAKGGMITKIEAAEIVMASGINMVIANGRQKNIIRRIMEGEEVGTFFFSKQESLRRRKRWIAFAQKSKRTIRIDRGAELAIIEEGKSLLPAGIFSFEGNFAKGEMVNIYNSQGEEMARGLVNYSAEELSMITGRKSDEIESILGYAGSEEVIHRDNLVLC